MINPKEYMIDLKGKQYLPVAPRIVMMREAHPDWAVHTEPVYWAESMQGKATMLVKATITDENGRLIATAHKTVVNFRGFDIEKAETGAIGRALSIAGFGTIQAGDMEEGDQIAEAPVDSKPVSNGNQRKPVSKPAKNDGDPVWMFAQGYDEFAEQFAEAHPYFKNAYQVMAVVRGLSNGKLSPWESRFPSLLAPKLEAHASKNADREAA